MLYFEQYEKSIDSTATVPRARNDNYFFRELLDLWIAERQITKHSVAHSPSCHRVGSRIPKKILLSAYFGDSLGDFRAATESSGGFPMLFKSECREWSLDLFPRIRHYDRAIHHRRQLGPRQRFLRQETALNKKPRALARGFCFEFPSFSFVIHGKRKRQTQRINNSREQG